MGPIRISWYRFACFLADLIVVLAIIALLTGCTTTAGDFCTVAKPIHPSAADIENASDQLVESVLPHNSYGAQHCAWRP
ncbi:hypothetical protein [Devosia submarina]|uniref:hypothetical protein n=1 Tax=Devosia submarina TaxID=1173082 RepID=UPI0013009AAA|nr:hypothetical protein [Devosia submarina]